MHSEVHSRHRIRGSHASPISHPLFFLIHLPTKGNMPPALLHYRRSLLMMKGLLAWRSDYRNSQTLILYPLFLF
jgi:hypothetical protein